MENIVVKTCIKDGDSIDIYGNLKLEISYKDFLSYGFNFGDIVSVKFLDYNITMPLVHSYKVGYIAEPQLVFLTEHENPFGFIGIIYIDSTMSRYKLGIQDDDIEKDGAWQFYDNIKFPIDVEISLKEKAGFKDIYELRTLHRSNNRFDYPLLSDDEYANFRLVKTKGMGPVLYRGSSPIQSRLNRYMYVDKALERNKIKNIINLTDKAEMLSEHEGYEGSYCSKQNILCLSLSVDMLSNRYKQGIKKAIKFIIDNEPPYYIHCVEGQDRTGFFCGMLEFFMGASFNEVVNDYMITFYNYYGIEKGDQRYPFFAGDMIQVYERCFETEPITNIDLQKASENYFMKLGFDKDDLQKLRERLCSKL